MMTYDTILFPFDHTHNAEFAIMFFWSAVFPKIGSLDAGENYQGIPAS